MGRAADRRGCTCFPFHPPAPTSASSARGGAGGTRLSLSKPGLFPPDQRGFTTLCRPLLVPCLSSPAALPLLGIVDAWVAPPARQLSPCPQSWVFQRCQAGAFPVPLHPGDTLGSNPLVASHVPRVLNQLSSAPLLPKKNPTGFFQSCWRRAREAFQPIKVPLQPPF